MKNTRFVASVLSLLVMLGVFAVFPALPKVEVSAEWQKPKFDAEDEIGRAHV